MGRSSKEDDRDRKCEDVNEDEKESGSHKKERTNEMVLLESSEGFDSSFR